MGQKYGIEERWEVMINLCNSSDCYKNSLRETFSDGIFSFGWLYVVSVFTENVCRKYPEMSLEIKKIFMDFIRH